MEIFTSAPLNFPAFEKTIFAEIKHMLMQRLGNSTVACDRAITCEFNQFLKKRQPDRPFWGFILWGFILYDAVHNYCDPTTPDYKPFQLAVKQCDRFSLTPNSDPISYVNRYHNAVYFVDSEVKKVLDDFKSHDLLKNTIVIITVDHDE